MTAVGLGVVSGFAIFGKLAPEAVYVVASLATLILAYFGITGTVPSKPPE